MPRRREIEKRDVLPDPKFNNKLVAKFVNSLLKWGKKSTAESILYGAFDIIEKKMQPGKIITAIGLAREWLEKI